MGQRVWDVWLRSLLWVSASLLVACHSKPADRTGEPPALPSVELVAGVGIGAIRVGTHRDALPAGAVFLPNQEGEYAALRFALERDTVREVWIPNLRYFPAPLLYRGQRVDRTLDVEELKRLFAPCTRAQPEGGRARYECAGGVVLGFDYKEAGELVRIRVRSEGGTQ
jgi:hypothetical protein